jgi:hypothetical protein
VAIVADIQHGEQPYRDAWLRWALGHGLTAYAPTFKLGLIHAFAGPL